MDITIEGKRFRTDPTKLIGQGGEAEIYNLGNGSVLKLYKTSTHPDFSGNKSAMAAATARIDEHQAKLSAFPKGMPKRVIAPQALAHDAKGRIVGFTMPFLSGGEVLLRYGERGFREKGGIIDDEIRRIYLDLHKTVLGIHKADVVIGDFNDLNVIVIGDEAHLIDADSMQFANFYCRVFTAKFVDPMLASESGQGLMLTKPHCSDSDWYAYTVMLMQALLYVGPYGGVFRPTNKANTIAHDLRPLKRVTVFHHEVKYPKPARHFRVLPDDLLHGFERVFMGDVRGVFPTALFEGIAWKACGTCNTLHARGVCPTCVQAPPAMVKEISTGKVVARKVFRTTGTILTVARQGGKLRWVYHEHDQYLREDGSLVTRGALDRLMRVKVNGDDTVLAKAGQAVVLGSQGVRGKYAVDMFGNLPIVDANGKNLFFVSSGDFRRVTHGGLLGATEEAVGSVLANRTLLWVGDDLGFGFYRAGTLTRYFLWHTSGRAINDSITLPTVSGQIIDSNACFGPKKIWLMMTVKEGSETYNRAYLIDDTGKVLANAEAKQGDGTWLSELRGKCPIGNSLFVPTDDGIVRVEAVSGVISVTKEFPDTARFVDSGTQLFQGDPGIVAVRNGEIWNLEMR